MYPNANIPILQLSIDYDKPAGYHYHLAKELAALRRKGVLIIGSGNMIHNLRMVAWEKINNMTSVKIFHSLFLIAKCLQNQLKWHGFSVNLAFIKPTISMNRKLLATTTIAIHATSAEVWEALVDPEIISQYMYGTETTTEWVLGSPITWSGEYQGKSYIDKGTILEIIPQRVLSYSYWSSMSATDDFEDNYAHISFHISSYDDATTLVITQDNLEEDEDVIKAEGNWMAVAKKIKEIVESTSELKARS